MNNTIALIATAIIIGGAVAFTVLSPTETAPLSSLEPATPVEIRADGTQAITINVKSGYHPRAVVAKAGIPTEVTFITNNNFDCSNDILIPALGNKTQLAPTDTKTVALGTRTAGETISGGCSMSMYNFNITFQ